MLKSATADLYFMNSHIIIHEVAVSSKVCSDMRLWICLLPRHMDSIGHYTVCVCVWIQRMPLNILFHATSFRCRVHEQSTSEFLPDVSQTFVCTVSRSDWRVTQDIHTCIKKINEAVKKIQIPNPKRLLGNQIKYLCTIWIILNKSDCTLDSTSKNLLESTDRLEKGRLCKCLSLLFPSTERTQC